MLNFWTTPSFFRTTPSYNPSLSRKSSLENICRVTQVLAPILVLHFWHKSPRALTLPQLLSTPQSTHYGSSTLSCACCASIHLFCYSQTVSIRPICVSGVAESSDRAEVVVFDISSRLVMSTITDL